LEEFLDDDEPYDRLGMNDSGLQNSDLFRERSLKHDRVKVSGSVDNDPCKSKWDLSPKITRASGILLGCSPQK
jgi:hypothetical protein